MKMTKEQALATLDDMRAAICADDSFEGSLSYSFMEEGLGPNEVELSAFYRIGNSTGQGGARVIPPSGQAD
ncbi:hypothetical protein [Methylobacterium fujisawaense]|jgi:hypothetical protein